MTRKALSIRKTTTILVTIFLIGLTRSIYPDIASAQAPAGVVYLPLVHNAYPGYGEMITIPTGSFFMGCDWNNPGVVCSADQLPLHEVFMDEYRIDKHEVTNEQYRLCIENGACSPPAYPYSRTRPDYFENPAYKDYPVIYVTYSQAWTYCQWAGKRLPTEAEWEKAARGGKDTRPYPWGDAAPDCGLLNYDYCFGNVDSDTTQTGSYPSGASPYGVMDMSGNVSEWVADWYDPSYYQYSPPANPPGPYGGTHRVIRGGSFFHDATLTRIDFRFAFEPGRWASFALGFRCARTLR